MDQLFFNIPRPYNKFPMGYRPMNGGIGAHTKSTLTLHSSGGDTNAFQQDPEMFFSNIALTDIRSNNSSSHNYQRRSADPVIKDAGHLPIPTSPVHSIFPHGDMPRSDFHKWRESQSNSVSCEPFSYPRQPLLQETGHSEQFLRKLQLQKEKIENYGQEKQLAGDLHYSYEIIDPTVREKLSKVVYGNAASSGGEGNVQSCPVIPSLLHKTRSDSSIFQEFDPRVSLTRNISTINFSSSVKEHRQRYDRGYRRGSLLEWRAPKEGFFALKHRRDPSWITHPPPPFALRERDDFIPIASRICNKNAGVSQVSPIKLDGGRILKFSDNQLIPERSTTFVEPELQISNSAEKKPQLLTHFPAEEVAQSQLCSLTHENCPSSNSNTSTVAVDTDVASRFAKSSYHDQRRSFNDPGENTVFAPTQSKVFAGFRDVGDNRESDHFYRVTSRETQRIPNRPKERTFAVVSRPQTPLASLQNVNDYINPVFSPQQHSSPDADGSRLLHGWSSIPPTSISFPDNDPRSRNLGSPMSSYDNESEADFNSQSCSHPAFSNNRKHNSATPAHGILVKSHEGGPRASKKVVFQCDSDGVDRLIHGNVVSTEAPPHVKAFDSSLSDLIERWSDLSDQIGGDVHVLRGMVTSVFSSLRFFLWTAASRREPASDEVQKLVAPIVNLLSEINRFKDSKRNTSQFNHLCAVAEGIPAVGWVLVKKTPAPYVKEMLESAMFYINRILKEFKEGDQKNVEWARLWKQLLEAMHTFVRETHTNGLVWNSAPGCSPSEICDHESAMSDRPTPSGHTLPPPPPPPPSFFADSVPSTTAVDSKAGRDALFAEINKGQAITAGLRKVTAEMQTHKNPALREQAANLPRNKEQKVQPSAGTSPNRRTLIELKDGKQWNVENVVGNPNVVINITDKKQTVYVYKCENSVIVIKGKLNSITLDSCRKTSVVFDAVVAQCETINCQSVQIQTLGEMPTLSIQKTDGCQVYLSEVSKNAEIVTSKSSEMNVLIPGADGDFIEFPIPEQFKTTFRDGKLVTCVSELA